MSPPTGQQICGTVPEPLAQRIRARADAAERSLSSEVAELLHRGVEASEQPRYQLADELHQLRRTTATIGRLGGVASTATGCWWSESIDDLPRPELLDVCDLIAMPLRVMLLSEGGSLTVDLAAGFVVAVDPAGVDTAVQVEPSLLLGAGANALPALCLMAQTGGPDRRELGLGLTVERLPDGRLRVLLNGIGPVMEPALGWRWAAELAALAVRGLIGSADRRLALEQLVRCPDGASAP